MFTNTEESLLGSQEARKRECRWIATSGRDGAKLAIGVIPVPPEVDSSSSPGFMVS